MYVSVCVCMCTQKHKLYPYTNALVFISTATISLLRNWLKIK